MSPPPAPAPALLSWPRLPGGAALPDLPGLPSRPQLLTRPHPAGTPGPYRLPTWLRRLIGVRRPLCEWPGCGIRAGGCDAEHDRAWPHGPTCACNLGPACRRHHRVKQLGWTKQRLRDAAVRWTSPTGRAWTSPVPHAPPEPAIRPLPALPGPADPLDQLGPLDYEAEWWHHDPSDPRWDDPDPAALELRTDDIDPDADADADAGPSREDYDPLRDRLLHDDTRWTLDLDVSSPASPGHRTH